MGSVWPVRCGACGKVNFHPVNYVNRAEKSGKPLYCDRACSGLARRDPNPPSDAERREAKAEYDRLYRDRDPEKRKADRAAYYQRTYDPEKERVARKLKMPRHVEYCRRPEYRAWKSEYDKRYLAQKQFGPFAESALLLRDLEQAVLERASRYDLDLASGKLNKSTRRKREYAKAIGC